MSNLHSLLHSNVTPEPEQIPIIHRVIEQGMAFLSTMEETGSTDPVFSAHLQDYVRRHQALLMSSPIRLLPVELIGEIAFYLMNDHATNRIISGYTLLMSSICQKWRCAMLSYPALWATISLDFTGHLPCPDHSRCFADASRSLQAHLCHARTAALRITVRGPSDSSEHFVTIMVTVIQPLLDQAERWGLIHVDAPQAVIDPVVQIPADKPLLRNLHLRSTNDHHPLDDKVFNVPWAQLASLTCIGQLQMERLFQELSHSQKLTEMNIQPARSQDIIEIYPRLTLPSLKRLHITICTKHFGIFDSMKVPSLIEFCLIRKIPRTQWERAQATDELVPRRLLGFFGHCNKTLKQLRLCDFAVSQQCVAELLALTPNVEHFQMRGVVHNGILRALADTTLAPFLRFIRLTGRNGYITPAVLRRCIAARRKADPVAGSPTGLDSVQRTHSKGLVTFALGISPAPIPLGIQCMWSADDNENKSIRKTPSRQFQDEERSLVPRSPRVDALSSGASLGIPPVGGSSTKDDIFISWALSDSSIPEIMRQWRGYLQRMFLSANGSGYFSEGEAEDVDEIYTLLERHSMSLEELQTSKIGKVLRHIEALPNSRVPFDDKYSFRSRSKALVSKWMTSFFPASA